MSNRVQYYSARTLPVLLLLAVAACDSAPTSSDALLTDASASLMKGSTPPSAAIQKQLADLRAATAPFHNVEKAVEAGYELLTPCWYHRDHGAQGIHYIKGGFPPDSEVDLLEPELLMYEPNKAGHLKLIAVEYAVPIQAGVAPPTLLGQTFRTNEGLGLHVLHVWIWANNPTDLFADWNPRVSCDNAESSEDRA